MTKMKDIKDIKDIKIMGAGLSCIDIIKQENQNDIISIGGTAANVASILSLIGMKVSFLQANYLLKQGDWLNEELEKRGMDIFYFNKFNLSAPRIIENLRNGEHSFTTKCPKCGKKTNEIKLPRVANVKQIYDHLGQQNLFYYDRISEGINWLINNNDTGWNFYEPNSIRVYDTLFNNIKNADIVKISAERIPQSYIEKIKNDFSMCKTKLFIITLGEKGIKYIYKNNGNVSPWNYIGVKKEKDIVDNAGAGDWLTASFLYYFLQEYPYRVESIEKKVIEKAFNVAKKVAAYSCYFCGAQGVLGNEAGIKYLNKLLKTEIKIQKTKRLSDMGCDFCKI